MTKMNKKPPKKKASPTPSKPKKKSKRSQISASLRYDLLVKARFRCQACGVSAAKARLEIDHKKPISKGGTNDVGNLQVLCLCCNRGKAAKHGRKL